MVGGTSMMILAWSFPVIGSTTLYGLRRGRGLRRTGEDLRREANVMWDSRRLLSYVEMRTKARPSPPPNEGPYQRSEVERERIQRHSYAVRRELYEQGARGWWTPDDQSRIVWTHGLEDTVAKGKACGERWPAPEGSFEYWK